MPKQPQPACEKCGTKMAPLYREVPTYGHQGRPQPDEKPTGTKFVSTGRYICKDDDILATQVGRKVLALDDGGYVHPMGTFVPEIEPEPEIETAKRRTNGETDGRSHPNIVSREECVKKHPHRGRHSDKRKNGKNGNGTTAAKKKKPKTSKAAESQQTEQPKAKRGPGRPRLTEAEKAAKAKQRAAETEASEATEIKAKPKKAKTKKAKKEEKVSKKSDEESEIKTAEVKDEDEKDEDEEKKES